MSSAVKRGLAAGATVVAAAGVNIATGMLTEQWAVAWWAALGVILVGNVGAQLYLTIAVPTSTPSSDLGQAVTVIGGTTAILNNGAGAVLNVGVHTPPRRVLTHEEMLRGLHGRRMFLLRRELRFIEPGSDHKANPKNLFARLITQNSRGILLTGAAGAGKTRTCFEVAAMAHGDGWHVLHVLASPVTAVEDLSEALKASENRRALLIFDYLDACPQLDLRELANMFLADAKRSGIEVAFLGSARPGSIQALEQRGVNLLFDEVPLRDDHMFCAQVADNIVEAIAPIAVRHWGRTAVTIACGSRPIIALLIARAMEQSLAAGHPVSDEVMLHSPELRPWLRDALRKDGLTNTGTPGPGPLDTSVPTAQEIACAAAVGVCPQPRKAVEATAEALLTADGPSPHSGKQVVEALLSLGWLEEAAGQLIPVHDIVVDELLTQALFPAPGRTVHSPSANALFAAISMQAGSFALFADHLRRILADMSAQATRHKAYALERFCGEWIVQHRDRLGALLGAGGESGEQALLTMVLNRPWRSAVQESWTDIGRPWFERAESALVATRFLVSALRSDEAPEAIVAESLSWLCRRSEQTDADQVIRALLSHTGLTRAQNQLLLEHGIRWVRDHPGWPSTPVILCRLLEHKGTASDQLEAARCALIWFTPRRAPEARAVLRHLLARGDLPDDFRNAAMEKALAWIRANQQHAAPFFATLLRSNALTEQQRHELMDKGLLWIQRNPSAPDRSSLINELFSKDAQRCLDALWSHVSDMPGSAADPIAIQQMLENKSITAEQARAIIRHAFDWLAGAEDLKHKRLIITAIMCRSELTVEESSRLAREVEALMVEAPSLKFLTALLTRGEPFIRGDDARRVITLALSSYRSHSSKKQRRQLINALLQRHDLTSDEAREVIAVALTYVKMDVGTQSVNCLNSLLERADLTPTELEQILTQAVLWLERNDSSSQKPFILLNLLRRSDISSEITEICEGHITTWLATGPSTHPLREPLGKFLTQQDARTSQINGPIKKQSDTSSR